MTLDSRFCIRFATAATTAAVTLCASFAAAAPFAEPPDQDPIVAVDPDAPRPEHDRGDYENPRYSHFYHPRSMVRVGVGPTLRLEEGSTKGGLFTHLDVGDGATGLRLSSAWIGVGSRNGLSQYGGELWLDFAHDHALHPVIGAGAALARLSLENEDGNLQGYSLGVGTLRAGLHYLLPVDDDTDARAALEVIGSLPAIKPSSAPRIEPWAMVVAGVQVGF